MSFDYNPVYMEILVQIQVEGILDSNPNIDHLLCVDCDPDSSLDPGLYMGLMSCDSWYM